MFKKKRKIKVEIPMTKPCSRCGETAKVNTVKITLDNIINVSYICDCGNIWYTSEFIDFI